MYSLNAGFKMRIETQSQKEGQEDQGRGECKRARVPLGLLRYPGNILQT